MKLVGKHTEEVAQRILEAFQDPTKLPKALAPILINQEDDTRPCSKWSWHNQLLVAMSGTSDARGYKQWGKVKRTVKKGSKALWILGPCIKKIKDKTTNEETTILIGFKSIPVFAIEDTEGEDLPVNASEEWLQALPFLEVARAWNIPVQIQAYANDGELGCFSRSAFNEDENQKITLKAKQLHIFAHELVHAADYRVGKLKEDSWHREIVAEFGSAILLEMWGIHQFEEHSQIFTESDLGGAYQYIKRNADSVGKDTVKACIEVLDKTCKAVKLILDTLESDTENTIT
jgi:hypothetical protein